MKLKNPFPLYVRLLFLYTYSCFNCRSNGNKRGGLELHHNLGRESDSAYNAVLLCGYCHKDISNTREQQQFFFRKSFQHLLEQNFSPQEDDLAFIRKNEWLVLNPEFRSEFLKQ